MEMASILVWILVAVCGSLWFVFQNHVLRKVKRLPPGPLGLPVVGNLFEVGAKPYQSLQRLSAKYGSLISLFMGSKIVIVVSSPSIAKQVYKNNDKEFAGRDPSEGIKVFGHNRRSIVFGQPDAHWRMLRRISTLELFSPKKLESLRHLRREQIVQILRTIYEKSEQNKAVDIRDLTLKSTVNLLGKVVLSRDMFASDSPAFLDFIDALHLFVIRGLRPNFSDFFPAFRLFDPQGVVRDAEFNMRKIYGYFDEIIQRRKQTPPEKSSAEKDVLDTLLDLANPDFTISDIIVYLSDIFIAGTDTTTVTMEWAMVELIKNPRVMQKAQAEIDEVVGRNRLVEETDVANLPYLEAIVKEILRLHAPVPSLLPHRAQQACEIEGYLIPKDAHVIVNYWSISKDPELWEAPYQFMPERFLQSKIGYRGQNFELIPFGAGRRICAGMPLANLVVHSLLGALIQLFDWSPPGGMSADEIEMSDEFAIARHKANPLQATASPRLPLSLIR